MPQYLSKIPPPHTPTPTDTLATSVWHSEHADLCLAMGSSLTVTPAADIPEVRGAHPEHNGAASLNKPLLPSHPPSLPPSPPPRKSASGGRSW